MPATARLRASRKTWIVDFSCEGKRWKRTIGRGDGAQAEAYRLADVFNVQERARNERDLHLYPGAPAPFELIARAWWDTKSPAMPNSSKVAKRPVVFERLIPYFGSTEIRKLDEDQIRACAVYMVDEKNHARETVETTGSVLDSIIRWAVRKGVLDAVPIPKHGDTSAKGIRRIFKEVSAARCKPTRNAPAWTREEVRALLDVAGGRGNWLRDPLLFASQTGCRRGELIALEWTEVDLERKRSTLLQSYSRGQTKSTKADRIRTVDLSDAAVEMLTRRAWDEFRGNPFETSDEPGRVFLDARGKPWVDHVFAGYWIRIRRLASARFGVRPFKFHAFRHTWATWALAAGEDAAWCAEQIGDRLDTFLRRYAHAMPGTKRSLSFLDVSRHVPEPLSGPACHDVKG